MEFSEDVQEQIDAGEIPPTVAYQVLKIEGEEKQRKFIADFLAGNTSTVEIAANSAKAKTGRPSRNAKPKTNKVKTIRGLKIALSSKERLTMPEIADRLRELASQYESDKRGKAA